MRDLKLKTRYETLKILEFCFENNILYVVSPLIHPTSSSLVM